MSYVRLHIVHNLSHGLHVDKEPPRKTQMPPQGGRIENVLMQLLMASDSSHDGKDFQPFMKKTKMACSHFCGRF